MFESHETDDSLLTRAKKVAIRHANVWVLQRALFAECLYVRVCRGYGPFPVTQTIWFELTCSKSLAAFR